MPKEYDFSDAIAELTDPSNAVGPEQLSIWGGELAATEGTPLEQALGAFLGAWDLSSLTYRIWELTDRIEFTRTTETDARTPAGSDHYFFERGRLFGPRGDLSLRRDAGRILWHFVGDPDVAVPTEYGGLDFWVTHASSRFRRRTESCLLWGKRQASTGTGVESWHDDRVGWAKLDYPHAGDERLQVLYTVYSETGEAAFVRLQELQKWQRAE